jgi:hypothetical protein
MNTIFKVENTRYKFMEVASLIDNWIYNYIECHECEKRLRENVLGNGIVALQTSTCTCNETYILKFPRILKKIKGDFLLVGKNGDQYIPLSEEQENFIISNLVINIEQV